MESVIPRLRVMLPYFVRSESLRNPGAWFPSLYSTGSVVLSKGLHSLNPASVTPSISTRNRNCLYGPFFGISTPLFQTLWSKVSFPTHHHSVTAEPPAHWAMRNMTNSAGFTGAMPISMMRRPLLISFGVMVLRSTLTKKASSGLVPASPPSFQTLMRNSLIISLTLPHNFSLFGSNTTH